jgi:peptidyl-prolyl cis-trans isomerase D
LEAQLRRDRATDRFGDIQEQLQTKIADPGADLKALAAQFQMQPGEVAQFAKGAGAAPLGAAPALQDAVFGEPPLAAGRVAGPVLLGDDRLVIFKVLERHKSELKPLAEVRASVVAALDKERAAQAALAAAQAAQARLEGGASFESVAQQLGMSADPAHFVSRRDPSIPAPVREAVFAAPRPAGKPVVRALALENGGAAVLEVTQARAGAVQDPQVLAERTQQQARAQGTGAVMAYVDEMRRTADVRTNPKAFE